MFSGAGGGGSRSSNYFVILFSERDPESPWQVCGYVQWHYFLYEYLHVLKTIKTKLFTRCYKKNTPPCTIYLVFFSRSRPRIFQSRYRYGNYDTISLFSFKNKYFGNY